MEFALAFGSVGDFIAIALLIKDIICALDDCRGSAKEYRDLIQELNILEKTLQEVEHIYNNPRLSDGLDDLSKIALLTTKQIQQCLEGFCDKIQKYGPSLAKAGTGNALKDAARKIQWKLEENDSSKFRADITGYTMSLQVLMEVTTLRILQRNHEMMAKKISSGQDRTDSVIRASSQRLSGYMEIIESRILSNLESISTLGMDLKSSTGNILSIVLTMSGELSSIRDMVMRLERPLSDEHFILEDVTGRAIPIHLKTITSWDAFEYILNDRFKGKKGSHRIRRNLYNLQERATRHGVDRSTDWESAFLPNQRFDMSLICQEAQKDPDERLLSSCPFCKTMSPAKTGVEVQCQNCNRFFTRVVELDEEIGAPEAPVSADQAYDARLGKSSSKKGNGRNNADSGDEKHSRNKSNRTSQEPESDSDDEDVRGFVRVTLVSKQRAIEVVTFPTKSSHAKSSNGEIESETNLDNYVKSSSSSSSSSSDNDAYEETTQKTVDGKLVATEADARKHRIPYGYSLKNWNPTEEPFLVLGSVFDATSVGKWINDWTVFQYGPDSPASLLSQELRLLLVHLAANIKRAEEGVERIRRPDDKDMVEDFLESGDRLFNRFKSLLEACEAPVIKASKKKSESLGVKFVKTLFGRSKELTRTEQFMTRVRLWNFRFDNHCLEILLNVSQ
ncbi:hypothetical protein BKA56DRAFT_552474 [Ilyonectria sp. MPI-CAGE-AT-0026]|nr:hypothetical protein BKA56DRAFT_552474 [Ilyonectria sp. MPI-CAGE-AT-0026]